MILLEKNDREKKLCGCSRFLYVFLLTLFAVYD